MNKLTTKNSASTPQVPRELQIIDGKFGSSQTKIVTKRKDTANIIHHLTLLICVTYLTPFLSSSCHQFIEVFGFTQHYLNLTRQKLQSVFKKLLEKENIKFIEVKDDDLNEYNQ